MNDKNAFHAGLPYILYPHGGLSLKETWSKSIIVFASCSYTIKRQLSLVSVGPLLFQFLYVPYQWKVAYNGQQTTNFAV